MHSACYKAIYFKIRSSKTNGSELIILHFWISGWSGFRITLNSSGIITEETLGVNNHQAENPYSMAFSSFITN